MYDDEDGYSAEAFNRRRQADDLEHIRSYYRLEERLGIQVAPGGRVRHDGREGTIVDTAGQYLMVRRDGEDYAVKCHVTASMAYETPSGWVEATPIPDPWASTSTGRG
jgi:hypothetical protein